MIFAVSPCPNEYRRMLSNRDFLGSVLAERIFRRFLCLGRQIFFTDFVAGCFLLFFVGESAQKNPQKKSPAKSSKNTKTTKIPDTFLQRGRAKISVVCHPPALKESGVENLTWSSLEGF